MSMRQPEPRVSVLIPAYDAESTIADALTSVLSQRGPTFEIILVDDGSQDRTLEYVRRAAGGDPRLRIIEHGSNSGRPAARNTAFAAARGSYVAMLDADDRFAPTRLARQVAFLDSHPEIDVVGSWWQGMDADGRLRAAKKNQRALSPEAVDCYLLFRGIIHNPTVMARRQALAGFEYDPAFPVAQDYDLWARMQIAGHRFAQIPEVLLYYRQHAAQASIARASEARARRCDIQARLLTALGMTFTRDDVIRHNLLYTGRRLYLAHTGRPMDRAFLDWAERWFCRLVDANQKSEFYPEPAFTDLVARLWVDCARKAARQAGRPYAVKTVLSSELGRHYLRRRITNSG